MNKNFKRLAFIPLVIALTFSTSVFAEKPLKHPGPPKANTACDVVMPIINSLPIPDAYKKRIYIRLCLSEK